MMNSMQNMDMALRHQDYVLAHWTDDPEPYFPKDSDGDRVVVGEVYWKTYDAYVKDDEDAIADYLAEEGYDPREYAYGDQTIRDDYSATLIKFDYDGVEQGARRER